MLRIIPLLAAIVLALAAPVFGQVQVGDIRPDNISMLEYDRPMLEYICAGAFIVIVLGIGFRASRRAHGS